MNNYIVVLTVVIGEYEKSTNHLVRATNSTNAGTLAMENESHNQDSGFDMNGDWWDDDMLYRVSLSKEISEEEREAYSSIVRRY